MNTRIQNYPTSTPHRQQGAVLIISLIILIALTIIVLSSARSSTMEMIMGVNSESQAEALADAEDAVRAGETYIQSQFAAGTVLRNNVNDSDTDGLYDNGDITLTSMDWSGIGTFSDASNEYIIEFMGVIQESIGGANVGLGDRLVYRVSGLGKATNDTRRIVQTYYATLTTP